MAKENKPNYLWIGIAVVVVIVLAIVFISNSNKNVSNEVTCNSPYIKVGTSCCLDQNSNGICDNDEKTEPAVSYATSNNLQGELKWVELMDIVGDVPRCPNGKNKGDIWLDFSIDNMGSISYSCKTELVEGEDIHLWSGEWGSSISGKVAFGQTLKTQHTVKVCCSSLDGISKNICKSFTLLPYC
jgi:hypothetical protein